ncbi:alpha/beta fold hydrolase [Pygmaiobacter massiliensis]|uniref:alpha/beta fold hydrolase n=1 Tax=Pygmaiobacter massiliensis TaxID=1917873 RepID=UPI000C7B6ABA|nr:alpha/beta hydrolase [Pygmaiobacter massiliensis]
MRFPQMPEAGRPVVILLHGGGLSDWSVAALRHRLHEHFCVLTPILDGHGMDAETTFISIEDSAQKLLDFIDSHCGGHIFALGGLSLGAQIAVEVLSLRPAVTDVALIESALCLPIPGARSLAGPTYALCYGLVKQRWFAKAQAKTLCLPPELFEDYFSDSKKMSKASLVNITVSNGSYNLERSLAKVTAKTLVIVGEKERNIMRRSAELLHNAIPSSTLYIADGKQHGELSICCPEEYAALFLDFCGKQGLSLSAPQVE